MWDKPEALLPYLTDALTPNGLSSRGRRQTLKPSQASNTISILRGPGGRLNIVELLLLQAKKPSRMRSLTSKARRDLHRNRHRDDGQPKEVEVTCDQHFGGP